MSQFIPTPAYPDAMPVDLSFVFADEKPAGKHGFLRVDGNHFRFEDGTRAKFWGVCLSGSANFPEHDYAECIARRLAQVGVNCVRTHWMDSEFNTPNIFAFTKGARVSTTRRLDPESLDRFDYLVSCLREQGIYIYLDNMTFRKFKTGDDVPCAVELDNAAKPYTIFDRRLIELQKEYITQLWTHLNPYTGLCYKDDPAVVLTEVTNENDLFGDSKRMKSAYYEREYRELFRDWLEKNGLNYDWETCDMTSIEHPLYEFKMDLTTAYYREIYEHLRTVGCRIPINGTNWYHHSIANLHAQKEMDFTDNHSYYWDWNFDEDREICANEPINGYPTPLTKLAMMRTNKPFFVSEWDMPWPNEYRAEGAVYYAAVTALQDWDGIGIFAYQQGRRPENIGTLGSEMSTRLLGNYPFESGLMSCWNDPAKFGLFYHAALIVRRGDVSPASETVAVTPSDEFFMKPAAIRVLLERSRVYTALDEAAAAGADRTVRDCDEPKFDDPNLLAADTGEVRRYLKERVAVIDTPRTQVVYGMLCRNRLGNPSPLTRTDRFAVRSDTDFGVVALSSLTDEPIERSDNLLLSAIGRAVNSGTVSAGEKMLDTGHAPILSEAICATVSIRTERTDLRVWGVNAEGYYTKNFPTVPEDGWLTFTIGGKGAALYYLIVAE